MYVSRKHHKFSHRQAGADPALEAHCMGRGRYGEGREAEICIRGSPILHVELKGITLMSTDKSQVFLLDGGRTWIWIYRFT